MPRRLDHSPFVHVAAAGQRGVLAVLGQGDAEADAYSRARRMSRPSCTPVPSSVNRRTPRAAISAIGRAARPARPTVMAPATRTSQQAPAPEVEHLAHDRGAESMAGSVLGMATTAV